MLKSLHDKGHRIKSLYDRIVLEMENRDEINKASVTFSELNIADKGKAVITNMEWNGKYEQLAEKEEVICNDDPDETDPLKLLAQSRHATKVIKAEEADTEVSLITPADIEEIQSFKREANHRNSQLEPHAVYMCSIEKRHSNEVHKEKFLPHKTTTSNVHSVQQEKKRQLAGVGGKRWENTSATPPVLRNGEVVALSLKDSIDNQRRQINIVKVIARSSQYSVSKEYVLNVCICLLSRQEIEQKQAEQRLLARSVLSAKVLAETYHEAVADNPDAFKTYRDARRTAQERDESDEEEQLDSDDEVHDLDDEPGGGVNIVVYDK